MIPTLVRRTYLARRAPTGDAGDAPLAGLVVERRHPCTVDLYRTLYAGVGARWYWLDRLAWSDARLAAWLARPDVHVHVLWLDDAAVGYFELLQEPDGRAELVYFGLAEAVLGRGLGRWLLARAMEEAWRLGAPLLWLHTCTLDGDAALPNYLARGFRPFRTEEYIALLPARVASDGRRR